MEDHRHRGLLHLVRGRHRQQRAQHREHAAGDVEPAACIGRRGCGGVEGGERERDAVVDGYREILEERATASEAAGRRCPPLAVDEGAREVTRERREDAFAGVLKRMLAGEQIRLVCACAPKRCHGDIIAARLRRMMREIVD